MIQRILIAMLLPSALSAPSGGACAAPMPLEPASTDATPTRPATSVPGDTPISGAGPESISDSGSGPTSRLGDEPTVVPPFRIGAGFLHQFDASLDVGGRYSVRRTYAGAGASFELTPTLDLVLSGAFAHEHYRFIGDGSFTPAPWRDVLTISLAPRLAWAIDDHWGVSAGPVVQFTGETGADFDDSIQWGGIASVRHAFDRDHVIGVGLLVLTQLEDDPLFLPVPLVDWHLGDGWRISNVRGPEANPFAGLELVKRFDATWEVAAGAAYSTRRFRLDRSGPIPSGVGEESFVPVFGRLTVRPEPWLRFDLMAGVSFLGRIELADGAGSRISVADADPAPILGIFGSIRF